MKPYEPVLFAGGFMLAIWQWAETLGADLATFYTEHPATMGTLTLAIGLIVAAGIRMVLR